MHELARLTLAAVLAVAAVISTSLPTPQPARAATAADPSDVVLVFDFSASIVLDEATRNAFADALDAMARQVDETAGGLLRSRATISFVRFASSAADVVGCTELRVEENPRAVVQVAECLKSIAAGYRAGVIDPAIDKDTNYVAALTRAAALLPESAERPAVVFFTDGDHDITSVPDDQVTPRTQALFADRPTFALLPVGLGITQDNEALETGLAELRAVRAFEPCEGLPNFDWPEVVFKEPAVAAERVAVALQEVICWDRVPPEPVAAVTLEPGDQALVVSWQPLPDAEVPVDEYTVACRTATGQLGGTAEVASTESNVTVDGLVNGTEYECDVVAFNEAGESTPVTSPPGIPVGPPGAVRNVRAEAGDASALVTWTGPEDTGGAPIEAYDVECSPLDGGAAVSRAAASGTASSVTIDSLENLTEYTCSVVARNAADKQSDRARTAESVITHGRPEAPTKPQVSAGDASARAIASAGGRTPVTDVVYECGTPGTDRWSQRSDPHPPGTEVTIGGLVNGTDYACRAIAANDRGDSAASPVSDVFRPCSGLFQCNPAAAPIAALLLGLLIALLLLALWLWWRSRSRAYINALVDDLPMVTLGRGPNVGFSLLRGPGGGAPTDVLVDPGPTAEVRIRYHGGDKFDVTSGGTTTRTRGGQTIDVLDADGDVHTLLLRAGQPVSAQVDDNDTDVWSSARSEPAVAGGSSDSAWD